MMKKHPSLRPFKHSLSAVVLGLLLLSAHAPAADQTATWNGTIGNWTDVTRWSTNPLFPNNGNGGFTFDAVQNAGTVTVNQNITIEKLTMSGGTNAAAGFTLTANDLFTWTGGELRNAGVTQADGGVSFSGAGNMVLFNGHSLRLGDDSSWSSGTLQFHAGAAITNESGNTFTNSFDGNLAITLSGTGGLNNEGTFTKSGGTGVTNFGGGVFLNNTGTVNVNSGTLQLTGGGTSTGTWNVAGGSMLNFANSHTLNAGTSVGGLGIVRFSAGTTNFNAGSYAVAGTTQINGGTANFNAAASTQLLEFSSGTLGGTGTVTVNGLTTFTGGTMTGAGITQANGGVSFSGTGNMDISTSRTLSLGAASTWSSGTIRVGLSGVLDIPSGVTLTNSFDGTLTNNLGGVATINNAGSFTKSAGAGTTSIGAAGVGSFNNSGTVNVNSGTLSFGFGGTHTGTFNVGAGNTLRLAGGTHVLNTGADYNGAGTIEIAGATVTANAPATMDPTVTFSSGTINGTATLTTAGHLTFTGGTMSDAGVTQANGGVTFSGAGNKILFSGRSLRLGDDSTWSGGALQFHAGAAITNESGNTFTNTFDGNLSITLSGTGGLNNEGTFTKSGGTGVTNFGGGVFLNNTGTVNASSGTITLQGGVTQHSGTTLTAGIWNVTNGASINITTGSDITTIGSGASVSLDGAGSSFAKVTNALNNNQGSFTLKNNRDLTTAGTYTNSGTTRVEDSTTVMTIGTGGSAAYTQTGGVTALVNGAFIDPSVFNLNGGTLQGTGTIQSNVIAGPGSNTIAPGMSPGTLTINGNLTLSSGSTLAMELGGLTQGSLYDYLDVNGVLTLAGMLDLDFINDFQNSLTSGNILTLATANSDILGSFSNVASGGYLMTNYPIALQVWYGAGSPFGAENLVVAIPEPSRAMLIMLGGLALLQRRRRALFTTSHA